MRKRLGSAFLAAIVLAALGAVPAAWSDEVVRLKNGNVLRGILKSREPRVILELPDLGTVSFAPEEVESIEAGSSAPVAYRHLVRLRNGNRLLGHAVTLADGRVSLDVPGTGTLIIPPEDIVSIEEATDEEARRVLAHQSVSSEAAAAVPVSPRASAAPVTDDLVPSIPGMTPEQQARLRQLARAGQQWQALGRLTGPGHAGRASQDLAVKIINVLSVFWIVGTIIAIVVYIYWAICLSIIAQKTETDDEWMAWLPVLNLVLTFHIAGKSPWLVLLYLVPLASLILDPWIWSWVARTRGRSGWLGLLMLVPLGGLVLIGYLAAAKDRPIAPEPGAAPKK